MEEEATLSTSVKKRPLWQRGWFLATGAICAVVVVVLGGGALLFVFPLKVEGSGMSPTFDDGDRIFAKRTLSKIERGDVVIFYFPKDTTKSFIKRIIALPGDTIRIDDWGVLYINGSETEEPYLTPDKTRMPRRLELQTLKPDEYFVMGDNRDGSNDSRSWGPVSQKLIYGKVVGRYWPSS